MFLLDELLFFINFLPLFDLDRYLEVEFDLSLFFISLVIVLKGLDFLEPWRYRFLYLKYLRFSTDLDYFFLFNFLPVLVFSIDFY